MTVAEIETRMSARELADWHLYWSAEPWGAMRDNMHAGLIAAAVYAPHIAKGKKPPTYQDFMLKDADTVAQDKRAQTHATLARMRAMAKRKPKP